MASKRTAAALRREKARKQKYDSMVAEILKLRTQGAALEVDSMLLVLELEKRPSYWRTTPATKFEDIIREEKFCTIARWRAFKKARRTVPLKHIRTLGVPASCLIAAQPAGSLLKLMRRALDFRKRHGIEPTYQYVTQMLPKRRKPAGPSRKQLLRYIDTLKGVIKRLGGKVPLMEDD